MGKTLGAELAVNNVPVELNPFVEEFLTRTVEGAVSSLRGTENIRDAELYLGRGDVRLAINGREIPLTPFPREIITATMTGLVSSLKGVGKIDTVMIVIKAR
jgi:hypothetical protein